MVRKLTEYNTGLMGTSASIYVNRMGGFVAAVKDYQDALMAYRGALKSSSLERTLAKQRAQTAFLTMQRHFQLELQIITSQIRARRGPP